MEFLECIYLKNEILEGNPCSLNGCSHTTSHFLYILMIVRKESSINVIKPNVMQFKCIYGLVHRLSTIASFSTYISIVERMVIDKGAILSNNNSLNFLYVSGEAIMIY